MEAEKTVNTGGTLDNGQFKKGDDPRRNLSGNPGAKHFRTIFEEAIKKIAEDDKSLTNPEKAMVVKAVTEAVGGKYLFFKDLMDRLYGKPPQHISQDIKGEMNVNNATDELLRRIDGIAARIGKTEGNK
jgi:hypothetical protein